MVSTTKSGLKVPVDHVKVVEKHRLGEGTHNGVFPQHVSGEHFGHKGPRNGHGGSHKVSSKGRK